jgi:hypothetical protein
MDTQFHTILDGPYDAVSTKRIDSNTRKVTSMKGGKEVRSSHGVVAKDGKSLRGDGQRG